MNKIHIVGSPGSGKSTLAKKLADLTGIEVFYLDAYFWKPGWVRPSHEEWNEIVDNLLSKDSPWIMEGNYSETMQKRINSADVTVLIDVPAIKCIYRVARRHGKSRPDVAKNCPERLNWDFLIFLKYIWDFPSKRKPRILDIMQKSGQGKKMYVLTSKKDIENFINEVVSFHRQKVVDNVYKSN